MVKRSRFRLLLFTLVVLSGFVALADRLWDLTIIRHQEFVNMVPGCKRLRVRVPGTRGDIRDRNGILLVTNNPSYEVQVNLKEVVDSYLQRLRLRDKHARLPTVDFDYVDQGVPRVRRETDIVKIVNEGLITPLASLGLAAPFGANQLRVYYRTTRGVVPWIYRRDLSFGEFSRFAEHNLGLAGISVNERPVRHYLYDAMACHVLGYVSQPDIQRTREDEKKGWDFFVPDGFGICGVEEAFDVDLRGRPGLRTMLQDTKGHIVRQLDYEKPRKGYDVHLTIDARIQYIAERALRESHPAIGRGAVVVLEPGSGEVLAMASVPSFNPNKFIPEIDHADFQAYLHNPCVPLLNRAVRAIVPGSTYKPMIAVAGILAGCEGDRWNCPGGITYGNKYMKCWISEYGGGHGVLNLTDALKNSCNCYFYQYGNHAGINNIDKAGKMFGMGQKTGIELREEDPGILPAPKWLRANRPGERWSDGTTANTSIGQGYVLATPLQMAGVAAAVGNGGIVYRPHLLKAVLDGGEVLRQQQAETRTDFANYGITAAKLELVRKGMWKVVNEDGGTARAARIPGIEVAGKTGTAQNWRPDEHNPRISVKDNHTLFIGFAPYVHPKYAICVFVDGGKSGGGCAAPIARRIFQEALDLDQGQTVRLAAVEEVQGNLDHIDQVTFDGILPVTLKPGEDEDAGTPTGNSPSTQEIIATPRAVPFAANREAPNDKGISDSFGARQ